MDDDYGYDAYARERDDVADWREHLADARYERLSRFDDRHRPHVEQAAARGRRDEGAKASARREAERAAA